MKNQPIRAVMFDLDGTLYSGPSWIKTRVSFRLWRDIHLLKHVRPVRDWLRSGNFGNRKALLDAYYDELARRAEVSPKTARSWYEGVFWPTFMQVIGKGGKVNPDIRSIFTALRHQGLKLAVLSDYHMVAERLDLLHIPVDIFDGLFSCEDWGALKPSPRPFRIAAKEMGLRPSNVLFVGDRYALDGVGAQAAGMQFLGIYYGTHPPGVGFVRWDEMIDHLQHNLT